MSDALLSKPELAILNKRSVNYKLADAEKDYFLAIVSKIIFESSLREKLVFKGGTAIHHCHLDQTRLSEDLDFTSLDQTISIGDVRAVFAKHDFLEIIDEYVSEATIKIDRLKYSGPLGLPNSLKIEIDFKQNVVLPAKPLDYRNAWKVKTFVNVMDVREICAEKIRAASGRARFRDFYDLALLFERYKFDVEEIKDLIRKKEIRKPISSESMIKNWSIAKEEKKHEISRIYYGEEIRDAEVEKLVQRINVNIPHS
ncbi:MAG: nucleotidyl transferase AbiEii/AbiGii toxin family protein [Candidatus Omnitrophota bacterium]